MVASGMRERSDMSKDEEGPIKSERPVVASASGEFQPVSIILQS